MWMSEHYLVLGSAEAWKCSRVPPLTRRHFNPQALIPFEPAQALTWDHMFGRAQALSCAMLRGREMKTFCQPLFPLQSDQSSSHPASIDERSPKGEKKQKTTTKRKKNTCAHSTISPALPGRGGKSKLHKADICRSDYTQIVDYCFD